MATMPPLAEPVHARELLDREGQSRWLRSEAQRKQALEQARYFAALVQLGESPHFEIVLSQLWQTIFLLRGSVDQMNTVRMAMILGEEELLLRLMKDLRLAREQSVHLAAVAGDRL